MHGPAEQRAQPAGLCATVVVRFDARPQHRGYNLGVHCINWEFVRKLMLPKAMCTGMVRETCTRVHSYFTDPLDTSELIADPAPIPADSKKP